MVVIVGKKVHVYCMDLDLRLLIFFSYTGEEQTFTAPVAGRYRLEVCGAQGGESTYGGKGAYASGIISLTKGQSVKVYVGGRGLRNSESSKGNGGYNG